VHTTTIEGFIESTAKRPRRPALAVVVRKGQEIVGVSLSREAKDQPGVWFHSLLAISKSVRGQGVGGGLLTAIIRLMGQPGRFQASRWYAEVPAYNTDVLKLYDALGWANEGARPHLTSGGTALIVRAFDIEKTQVPKYWHEQTPGAPVVESRLVRGL
jgi:ribosomal protein S18 acetylase RimI-like enzyme